MNKPRVLFAAEYSQLSTGYAVYVKHVLEEMHKTGKYELAEFSSYCSIYDTNNSGKLNEKALSLPWKVYPNLFSTDEEKKTYLNEPENAHGKWRFDRVVLDFHPDYVLSCRDIWMDEHIYNSFLRPYYNILQLAPVDSMPQRSGWFEQFIDADAVLTFTDWGKAVLDDEGGGAIKTIGAAPGCVNPMFQPVKDKAAHKDAWNFDKNAIIIGTVMRNQKRKLYPELMESFIEVLKQVPKNIADNLYLFLYTAYPDMGWHIPELINDYGLGNKILMAYVCQNCEYVFASYFKDARTNCPKCKHFSCVNPSTQYGISDEKLVEIYNLFDIYVQYAVCEGQGFPIVEAASCGVPVIGVDYSAMSEVVRKCNGYLVQPETLFKEPETAAYRAYPDNGELTDILVKLLTQPPVMLAKAGRRAKEGAEKYYTDWSKTAKVWMDCIDNMPLTGKRGQWDCPPTIIQPITEMPDFESNNQFVVWCIINLLKEPELLYDKKHIDLVSSLNLGYRIQMHHGEHGGIKSVEIDRKKVMKSLLHRIKEKNYVETARVSQLGMPDYIQFGNKK